MRNIYQDLVTLLYDGRLTKHEILRRKGEMIPDHHGDRLVNQTGKLTAGRNYREEREMMMRDQRLTMRYCFLTRCWSYYLQEYLDAVKREDRGHPDLVLVLSCLWDINRYILKYLEDDI